MGEPLGVICTCFWVILLLMELCYVTNIFYILESFFALFLSGISSFVLLYRECHGLQRAFFHPQAFFTLNSFPTFGISTTTICFYQGFSESWKFFLEGCRVFHCGLKYRPVPYVCLYLTVFRKRYYSLDLMCYAQPWSIIYSSS